MAKSCFETDFCRDDPAQATHLHGLCQAEQYTIVNKVTTSGHENQEASGTFLDVRFVMSFFVALDD